MLFGPRGFGASIDLSGLPSPRLDALLFGESQGRVVIAVPPDLVPAVLEAAGAAGVPADAIGAVTSRSSLSVKTAAGTLEWTVAGLRIGWDTSIEVAMKRPGLS
jgi:phosphoribosylformylglycinamidine (FGAM) synthase-like enzyme